MAEAYGLSSKSDESDEGNSLSLQLEESVINHPINDDTICQGRPSRKRIRKWIYCDHCKQEVPKSTYYRHKKLRVSEEEAEPGAVSSLDDSDDYEEHKEQCNADADSNSSEAVLIENEVEPPTDDIDWHVEV